MHRTLLLALPFLAAVMLTAATAGEKKKDDGYVKIFDGKSLDGWHISAKTGLQLPTQPMPSGEHLP